MAKNRIKEQRLRDFKNDIHKKILLTNEELNALTGHSVAFWRKEKESGNIKVFAHESFKDTKVSIWSLRDYIKQHETFIPGRQ